MGLEIILSYKILLVNIIQTIIIFHIKMCTRNWELIVSED
jgi:hypothetical protein